MGEEAPGLPRHRQSSKCTGSETSLLGSESQPCTTSCVTLGWLFNLSFFSICQKETGIAPALLKAALNTVLVT